jgi:hypothetical protein
MKFSIFSWIPTQSEGFSEHKYGTFNDNGEIDLSLTEAETLAHDIIQRLQNNEHVTLRVEQIILQ